MRKSRETITQSVGRSLETVNYKLAGKLYVKGSDQCLTGP